MNHPMTGMPLSATENPLANPENRLPKIGILVRNAPIDLPRFIIPNPKFLIDVKNPDIALINVDSRNITINPEKCWASHLNGASSLLSNANATDILSKSKNLRASTPNHRKAFSVT